MTTIEEHLVWLILMLTWGIFGVWAINDNICKTSEVLE